MDAKSLMLSDLLTGIFASLAEEGKITSLSLREHKFECAVERLVQQIKPDVTSADMTLRIRVRIHPVYGDSPVVQQGLFDAAQRNLISLDNPEFQDATIKIKRQDAQRYLEALPGSPDLYRKWTKELMQIYLEDRQECHV
ncbi:MAG: hypothetical protein U0931_33130 [Vulcanimicrobiota bacterium]